MLVSDLQTSVAYKVGDTAAPAPGTDDYNQRLSFANEGNRQWSERWYWTVLKRYSNTITTVAGQNWIQLPTDFDPLTLTAKVFITDSNGNNVPYKVVPIEDVTRYATTSNICYTQYDITTFLWRLYFQPIPTISGLIVKFYYKSNAPILASNLDMIIVDNPDWLVYYVTIQVLLAQQSAEQNAIAIQYQGTAEQMMQQMIANDSLSNLNSISTVRTSTDELGGGYGI